MCIANLLTYDISFDVTITENFVIAIETLSFCDSPDKSVLW